MTQDRPVARSAQTLPMSRQTSPEIEMVRAAYAAFNARDANATLAFMTPDVALPNGMEGGTVEGQGAVRAYWARQWAVIHPHDEPISFQREADGRLTVHLHQVVRDTKGTVVSDEQIGHRVTIERGLIQSIELCSLPAPTPDA